MSTKIVKILATILFFTFLRSNKLEAMDSNGHLLGVAAGKDVKIIQQLLDKGADVNYQRFDLYGIWTPLYYAIANSNLGVVKCFIYNGADINIKMGSEKHNALELAEIKVKDNNEKKNSPTSLGWHRGDKPDKVLDFLEKHALRMQKIKVKSLKYVTQKVNQILPRVLRTKINSSVTLPKVLEDMILGYCELYPTNSKDFFKLSDEEIDGIIKIYSEEFEKEEMDKKNEKVSNKNCLIM